MIFMRRMALAGMLAALGAGSFFVLEQGPAIVANAAAESVQVVEKAALETIISRKGLDTEAQEVLMSQLGERYPRTAAALKRWTPVTAAKIAALHEAYQQLDAQERTAIAQEVATWQTQVWQRHAAIRETWQEGGKEREVEVAKRALDLKAPERAKLDASVNTLWQGLSERHPAWAREVDAIMRAQ